jgi:iron complex transport system substrate-binding protein
VAGTLTSPEHIATLRRLGIRVDIFDTPNSFAEICEHFVRLGALVDKETKAERIVNESKKRIETVSAKVSARWRETPRMFFQIGANPLFTVLPNTFMDDYITFLGGQNIAQNLRTGIIGREFVIAQNPDFIFIATMGAMSEEEKNVWQRHSRMNAARNGRIFMIDADIACLPTPITFAQTMEILFELIWQ